jgi:hypothetical protein
MSKIIDIFVATSQRYLLGTIYLPLRNLADFCPYRVGEYFRERFEPEFYLVLKYLAYFDLSERA